MKIAPLPVVEALKKKILDGGHNTLHSIHPREISRIRT